MVWLTFHGVQGVHLLQSRVADKPDGLAVAFVVQKLQRTLVKEDILCLTHTNTQVSAWIHLRYDQVFTISLDHLMHHSKSICEDNDVLYTH